MSAYMIVKLNFRDLAWSKDYLAQVPAMLRRYGGEYLARSRTVERFEGAAAIPDHVAILTFPSLEAIGQFVNSPEYAPFRSARIASTVSDIVAFET